MPSSNLCTWEIVKSRASDEKNCIIIVCTSYNYLSSRESYKFFTSLFTDVTSLFTNVKSLFPDVTSLFTDVTSLFTDVTSPFTDVT